MISLQVECEGESRRSDEAAQEVLCTGVLDGGVGQPFESVPVLDETPLGGAALAVGPGPLHLATGPATSQTNPDRPRGGDLAAFELIGPGEGAVFKAEQGGSRAIFPVEGFPAFP